MSDPVRILCLETSSQFCSVAILDGQKVTEVVSPKIQNHAEVLMTMINDCCLKAELTLNQMNAVAISDGPGSYTGLRIGSSTAKGICFALNIPLIAVSTLKALAWDAVRNNMEDYFWPMIDARRMEVYHGVFDRDLNLVAPINNGVITDNDFVPESLLGKSVLICGDGSPKTEGILRFKIFNNQARASFLCELASTALRSSDFANTASYEPFYLKSANITQAKH